MNSLKFSFPLQFLIAIFLHRLSYMGRARVWRWSVYQVTLLLHLSRSIVGVDVISAADGQCGLQCLCSLGLNCHKTKLCHSVPKC